MMRDAAGLLALVQIGSIEIHAWGSTLRELECPDQLTFDLDPDPDVPFKQVIKAARDMQKLLQAIRLNPFVKTTGGKGLHVVVPIEPTVEWQQVKQFCKSIAEELARADPAGYTTNMRKSERVGRVFVDYLRNGRTATAVVPYSVRWRAGAPVAMPLAWSELGRIRSADQFTVKNAPRRVARVRDPWAAFNAARVDIRQAVGSNKSL
jgi:bifunctional non-homologous end joining protein LigD